MLTSEQKRVLEIMNGYDNYDSSFDDQELNHLNKNQMQSIASPAKNLPDITPVVFGLQFGISYYNVTGAAALTAAALAAAAPGLAVPLPVYVFGQTDFRGGFTRARQLQPPAGGASWLFDSAGIYGKDAVFSVSALATTILTIAPLIVFGDLWIAYQQTVAAVRYAAVVRIHCVNVAYGTLLESLSSDMFTIRQVQFTTLLTTTATLDNAIQWINQGMFGKSETDTLVPSQYITGGTFNQNIANIPLKTKMDKNLLMAYNLNFDAITNNWSINADAVRKLL